MKTIFGRKSFLAIENREFLESGVIGGVVLISGEGLSRYRRNFRGRSQPRRAVHHGSNPACWGSSRETQTLQSSRYCQTTVLLLTLLMIGLVMWPSFQQQVESAMSKVLHKWYYEVAAIHAALGITAEFLGLYIVVVAGTNALPQWLRFKHWKWWMRTELVLWAIVLLGGVGTYCAWYVAPFRQ